MDRRSPRGAVRVAATVEPAGPAPLLEAAPFDYGRAERLAKELDLQRPTAVALTRRGIDDADKARSFLAPGELPPPNLLAGVDEAVAKLRDGRADGRRITVFGDFDVDGVCGTAILVSALRRLGADCDWFIPDRVADGYGLSERAVERLGARGTGLLVTVDCGVTAVAEVAAARRLGLEVIVTDHHQRGAELPDCLVVHPGVSGYSCPNLCGAAVAWKLASALGQAVDLPLGGEPELDLVALATVADLVPLTGENRQLVKHGLTVARRAARPGMRALIQAAGSLSAGIDERDLGFRLGPRINAAGRLYRADAGVELFLTEDDERASQIAEELNRANQERRDIELRVLGEAETALRRLRDDGQMPAGLVVSGDGWHPGVIGIVASRLVESHRRPAIVISVDDSGRARGSGRGMAGFDLLAALRDCDELLGRYGGHRAAAGLELASDKIADFTAAFAAASLDQLGEEARPVRERVDAFAAGPELGLTLAEELELLGPFGIGNPGVNLVVPGARIADARPMGTDGAHLRFTVHSGGHRARAVAFARNSLGCSEDHHADLVMRLERNEWNGGVEPRLRLRELVVLDLPGESGPGYQPECLDEEWWRRFETVLERGGGPGAASGGPPLSVSQISHQPGTGLAVLAELLSSGVPVLAVSADAGRRAGLTNGPSGPGRFAEGDVSVCSSRDGRDRFRATLAARFGLTDYLSVSLWPDELSLGATADRHVALIDPPASSADLGWAARAVEGAGMLHRLWDEPARSFALKALADSHELRQPMAAIYRALRDRDQLREVDARALLEGEGPLPISPEQAAACVAVLAELGLVESADGIAGEARICARHLRAVSSKRTDLERSRLYGSWRQQYEVKSKFLQNYR